MEILDKFITSHLDDFHLYYEKLKNNELLVVNHNLIPSILLEYANSFEKWIELVKRVYGYYFNAPKNGEKLSTLKSKDGICTCNFNKVYPITANNIVVSSGGKPPSSNLCPFGLLTLLSLTRVNKYIYLSSGKVENEKVENIEIIPSTLYLVLSPFELSGDLVLVYKRDASGGRNYRPVDRSTS